MEWIDPLTQYKNAGKSRERITSKAALAAVSVTSTIWYVGQVRQCFSFIGYPLRTLVKTLSIIAKAFPSGQMANLEGQIKDKNDWGKMMEIRGKWPSRISCQPRTVMLAKLLGRNTWLKGFLLDQTSCEGNLQPTFKQNFLLLLPGSFNFHINSANFFNRSLDYGPNYKGNTILTTLTTVFHIVFARCVLLVTFSTNMFL